MFGSREFLFAALIIGLGVGAPGWLAGEEPKPAPPPVKIGLFPFDDATGEAGTAGQGIIKWVRADMAQDKRLLPRVLTAPAEGLDRERAVALGKEAGVDAVLLGTILEANVDVSQHGGTSSALSRVGVGGVGSSVSSAKAEVILQGELVSVATGDVLLTERVTGKKVESKIRGDVQTNFGSMNLEGDEAKNSPLGKALKDAVEKLVHAVAQNVTKPASDAAAKK